MTDSFWVEKRKTAITVYIPKIYDLLQCKNPNRSSSESLQNNVPYKGLTMWYSEILRQFPQEFPMNNFLSHLSHLNRQLN